MARVTHPLAEMAPGYVPIFADPDREYDYVVESLEHAPAPGGVEIAAATHEGERLTARVAFVTPHIMRLQCWRAHRPPERTPMLVFDGAPPAVRVEETSDALRIASDALLVTVQRKPWRVRVDDAGGREVWSQRIDDYSSGGYVSFPLGYSYRARRRGAGGPWFHESMTLRPGERLYGLGERYGPLDKRGTRHVFWVRDTHVTNTSDMSYLAVPFFWSSAGYGVFLNHTSPLVFELGSPSLLTAAVRVEDPYLDEFVIAGPSPREILSRYWDLTGRAPLPPLWSFGVWMSRCMYRDADQMRTVAERLRELDIPCDVLHADPRWLQSRKHHVRDGCDFVWDDEAFGDPQAFVDWLADRGFRLSLWENPYVWTDTELYREGAARRFFVRGRDGQPALSQDNPAEAAVVDFTNSDATRWWQDRHRPYLRMGVATFKSDYGEGLPPDARMSDGRTGRQWHNAYPLLYNRAVWEVIHEERGEAIVFGRSGYAGSQRYPLNWTGDAQTTWDGMAGALRAGLSLSDSGIPFWCHDIGGFWNATPEEHPAAGPPEPALYIRWAQFGLFSSHSRFHGVRGREPWWYGDDAVEIVRRYAKLRYRLLPYIWAAAREATQTALPVVRPMHLAFPHDPAAAALETQYLFGPSLLVAPVLNPEGRALVYLPTGTSWHDFWTGERIDGGRWLDLTLPLDTMPVYVRGDAIVLLGPEMAHTGQKRWEPLELRVWCETEASVHVAGEGVDLRATARRGASELDIALEGHGHVVIEARAPAIEEWRVEGGSGRQAAPGVLELLLDGPARARGRIIAH